MDRPHRSAAVRGILTGIPPDVLPVPAKTVPVREAIPGATFSAVAWTLSAFFLRVYATTVDSVELYGIAGAVLLVLTWLYLGGLILLFGAILNAVLAGSVDADDSWLLTEEANTARD